MTPQETINKGMRRIGAVALLACFFLLLALPASAQTRDPFSPAPVGAADPSTHTGNAGPAQDPDPADETETKTKVKKNSDKGDSGDVKGSVSTDVLPLTGNGTETLFVGGYALVVLGLALLAYSRLGRRQPGRLSRSI